VLAVIGLLSFIGTMNDFLIASVILVDPDKQTLAVGLYQFVSQETARNWSVFAAGAVLAAILPMALFLSAALHRGRPDGRVRQVRRCASASADHPR
jgi:arabinogalactan oligomer/maltooligosaccharide transport system permease protein